MWFKISNHINAPRHKVVQKLQSISLVERWPFRSFLKMMVLVFLKCWGSRFHCQSMKVEKWSASKSDVMWGYCDVVVILHSVTALVICRRNCDITFKFELNTLFPYRRSHHIQSYTRFLTFLRKLVCSNILPSSTK